MKTFQEFMMIAEGMTMKDFKANRRKLKRREASADAEKRGHVGKEWYNSGRKYSPDEAKRMRSKLDDEERSTRHRSAIDPEGDDSDYSANRTKNAKKLRKQKAMGELGEERIDELFVTRKSAEERTDEKRKKKVAELIRLMKHAKDPSSDVAKKPVAKEELEIDEGMTMKDFKKQRSRQKQKDKRQAEKTSPTRRVGIHNPSASPERAARHRANVDPDFEGNDERNYPGGVTKSPKKIRKQKAVGEIN